MNVTDGKVRVLIVDDSVVVREILRNKLGSHPRIHVVGVAADPFQARTFLEREAVDVVTLDIEMPRMDGLTFLKYLMKYSPLPVIMVSSLTDTASRASLDALALGAVDMVLKPDAREGIEVMTEILAEKVLQVSRIDRRKLGASPDAVLPVAAKRLVPPRPHRKIIVVGASTGGPQALETLLRNFPSDFPPTLVVIHMPERFTKSFAQRLDSLMAMNVREAVNNEKLLAGTIYVAPGNCHMTLRALGEERFIRISSGPKVCNQRPSVDVLFQSAAEVAGKQCLGVLLTGMGKDGAHGLKLIRDAGGHTVAQDEATSIVFGMPREAIALGAADEILPLHNIASHLKRKISLEVDSHEPKKSRDRPADLRV